MTVAHPSRKLSWAVKDHGQTGQEILALIFPWKTFPDLFHDQNLNLIADHNPLLPVIRLKGLSVVRYR